MTSKEKYELKYKKRRKKLDKQRWRMKKRNVDHRMKRNLCDILRKAAKRQDVKLKLNHLDLLGCTWEEFKSYLEELFYPANNCEMDWINYGKGGWELDHIQPLSSFDLGNKEELKTACFFSNIQPLWRVHNEEKGDFEYWVHPMAA